MGKGGAYSLHYETACNIVDFHCRPELWNKMLIWIKQSHHQSSSRIPPIILKFYFAAMK
jgi:hypothetical protein